MSGFSGGGGGGGGLEALTPWTENIDAAAFQILELDAVNGRTNRSIASDLRVYGGDGTTQHGQGVTIRGGTGSAASKNGGSITVLGGSSSLAAGGGISIIGGFGATGGSVSIASTVLSTVILVDDTGLSFFGVSPSVPQQAHIADATDATDVIARCNDILAALRSYGLLASS